ncbi:MAG: BufA2 family periplasmic bufferin-type metallophore [Candidatus Binatia bacterium]
MKNPLKGALLAATVASLFLAGSAAAAEDHGKKEEAGVKCTGVNACKGKGACAGAGHSCGGKNECKGKGMTKVSSAKECTDKGGTVEQ